MTWSGGVKMGVGLRPEYIYNVIKLILLNMSYELYLHSPCARCLKGSRVQPAVWICVALGMDSRGWMNIVSVECRHGC